MRDSIKKYMLVKWWVPILPFLLTALLFVYLLLSTNEVLVKISDYSLLLCVLILLIAGIWQLVKGKWYLAIIQIAILILGIIGVLYLSMFLSFFGPDTDTFSDNLKIPENITIESPLESRSATLSSIQRDSIHSIVQEPRFQLYRSFQPGLYEYDIWIKTMQSGTVYLKAFEITQEIELSKIRLKEMSSILITNTFDRLKKFGTSGHFTIYEGDWGKPYGARFEVWFIPDDQNDEIKLFEKNYIIEGWMR